MASITARRNLDKKAEELFKETHCKCDKGLFFRVFARHLNDFECSRHFRNTNIDRGFELIYRDFYGSFVIFYILLPRLFERSSLKCFLKSVRWSVGHKFEKMTADSLPHVANIYLSCLYAMFIGLKFSLTVESRLSISLPFLQEVTLIVAVVDASTEIVRNTWRSSNACRTYVF